MRWPDRLRISRAEVNRRVGEAQDLGARRALSGEPVPPRLAATAAGQRAGAIGAGQVSVIRQFVEQLPCWIDEPTRERAKAQLARHAAEFGPEQLAKLADKLADCLNLGGNFTDEDRARRRGLTLGKQDPDGMSPLRGWLTPAARASLEAVLAKLAAPGMANPYDPEPVLDGTPSEEAIQRDTPAAPLSGITTGCMLPCGRCWPAENSVSTMGYPLRSLSPPPCKSWKPVAGRALTGGGSLLPMSEVIRLASHAHHYLAIFDKGRAIGLYQTKRLASPGQRIVLYARDRGCSHPGCDVPGYFTEVHHVREWARHHETHIDDLTLGCGSYHRLITPGGWTTRKRKNGDTEWIPPQHLDYGQPRTNKFHHPERLLRDDDEDDP